MATFLEVISHIKSNYITQEISGGLTLEFTVNENRSQVIFVIGQPDSPLISISSPFAKEASAEFALQAAEASIFGIKKVADMFAIHHVVPLADIDASEIEFGLKLVASQADLLEGKFGGDRF